MNGGIPYISWTWFNTLGACDARVRTLVHSARSRYRTDTFLMLVMHTPPQHHIVILGAGFGGLRTALEL